MCTELHLCIEGCQKGQGVKKTERAWSIFDSTITVLMGLAAALIIFDMLAVSVEVILRYFFTISISGLFEITEYSLLWITFLATAWILRNNGHIRVDLVINRLNPRRRAGLNIVSSIICIFLLVLITWYSVGITIHDFRTGFTQSTVLEPVKWPIEIIIPIGTFLLLVQLLRNTYGYLMSRKALPKGPQTPSDSTSGGEL